MPVITAEPEVMFSEEVNPETPASAAKITWPLGKMAPGASSAPKGDGIPFSVPLMSGPAAQVFVAGLYSAGRQGYTHSYWHSCVISLGAGGFDDP